MHHYLLAGLFEIAGLYSLFRIVRQLKTGVVNDNRGYEVNVRANPGGFYLQIIACFVFAILALALALNQLELISDPLAWLRETFPFLTRR
jgi:drug/metabolite transporter superfamily protein YnfA